MNFMLLAETAATGQNSFMSGLITFVPLILIVGVFYFLVIRPQKNQERQANELKNSLQVGDEITTIGGIVGVVVRVKDDLFTIITSNEKTRITFQRSALRSIDMRDGQPYTPPAPVKPSKKKKGEETAEETKQEKKQGQNK